eukprot:scaffold15294_cov24-Tisochrysis_lutea.AAC.1
MSNLEARMASLRQRNAMLDRAAEREKSARERAEREDWRLEHPLLIPMSMHRACDTWTSPAFKRWPRFLKKRCTVAPILAHACVHTRAHAHTHTRAQGCKQLLPLSEFAQATLLEEAVRHLLIALRTLTNMYSRAIPFN